jgi:hypothetical protein
MGRKFGGEKVTVQEKRKDTVTLGEKIYEK